MGHTGPRGTRQGWGRGEPEGAGSGREQQSQASGSLKTRVGGRLVVPSDTGQPFARSSCGSAGPPGTPLWSPHAPWPAAGHTHPRSGPLGPIPPGPSGSCAPPPPQQPGPTLTIWILSVGRAASGPSPGQPLCDSQAVALGAGGRTPGLLLLVEKLALGSGAAWGMGRTVAVGAAGAGVLGGGSRGTGTGVGSSGLCASRRKRW